MSDNNTTWIIGAGFSRSLGGPLLPDLISDARHSRLVQLFTEHKAKFDGVLAAYNKFHVGGEAPHSQGNAEDFLELL